MWQYFANFEALIWQCWQLEDSFQDFSLLYLLCAIQDPKTKVNNIYIGYIILHF